MTIIRKLSHKTIISLLIIAILASIFVFSYLVIVPNLINIEKYRPQIEKTVQEKIDLPINIGKLNVSTSLDLSINIHASNIDIKHSDNREFIYTGPASVKIFLPSLLRKKVVIKEIKIAYPVAHITRLENGKFDIEQLIPKKAVKPQKYKVIFRNTGIIADNYQVYFRDKHIKPEQNYSILGKNIKISDFEPKKNIKISANGQIIVLQKPNTQFNIILTANRKNLTLEKVIFNSKDIKSELKGKIFNYLEKNKILDLKLIIDNSQVNSIINIFPKQIKVPLDPFNKLPKYNVKGNVWTDLIIKGPYKKPDLFGNLKFNNFSMIVNSKKIPKGSGEINFLGNVLDLNIKAFINSREFVKVTGSVSPIINKSLSLDVVSNTVDINKAQQVLFAVRDIFEFKLGPVSLMDLKGRGKVVLNISGKFKNPNLKGYLDVFNGWVYYQGLSKPAHDVKGLLKFDSDRVLLNNISGFVDQSKVIADGYITLLGFSDVKLTFPGLNLNTAHQVVFNSSLLKEVKDSLKIIKSASGIADTVLYLVGTEENLKAKGTLLFKGANVVYEGFAQPFTNLVGQLRFIEEKVFFDKLKGIVAQSPVIAEGISIGDQKIDLLLTSPRLNLYEIRKFIKNSPVLFETEELLKDFTFVSGYAKTSLKLAGNLDEDIFQNTQLDIINAKFEHKEIGLPVELLSGRIFITTSNIFIKRVQAKVLDTPIKIAGQAKLIGDQVIPQVRLDIKDFELAKVKSLAKTPLLAKDLKEFLAAFDDFKGRVNAYIDIFPQGIKTNLMFNRVSAKYTPADIPLKIYTGGLIVAPGKIVFNNLHTHIAKSFIYFDGIIKNPTEPVLDMLVSARINSEDIKKYINPFLKNPINAEGIISTAALINGKFNDWKILAQMTLGKGDNIFYPVNPESLENKIRVITLNATGSKNRININNLEAAYSENPMETNFEPLFNAKGTISKIRTSMPVFKDFYVKTADSLNIDLLNPAFKTNIEPFFARGAFKADIQLEGKISSPKILGNILLNDILIPSKDTNIGFADINFNENEILVKDSNITVDESPMQIQARLANVLDFPLLINEIKIYSPSLNIDRITKALRQSDTQEQEMADLPPFLITKGELSAKELIVNNLITTDVVSGFNFTPDWLLSIPDVSFKVTGGSSVGGILFNLKTTELSTSLSFKDVQANAAATTLLSLPNEVYGTLNGKGQFYTKGNNSQEMIANSNGFASFQITDGRLVRLGSLEYLLRAVNVVQSGVGGLNINNILDLIIPQKTGDFEILEGSVQVKDGILRTDNITSKGKNLSLFLSGSLDMVTNYADITILGKLSQKVSGLLGPLGSLSINQFIGYIPGIGFLPSSPEKGLIDLIPGLNKIPGLGLKSKKYRRFMVEIKGDLYNPGSVKSFRWLD
ncbi:MAG: AsmA-like C-terminal region-containing protein [bacterium]